MNSKLKVIILIIGFIFLSDTKISASSFSISPDKIINNSLSNDPLKLQILNPTTEVVTLNVEAVMLEDVYENVTITPMDEKTLSRLRFLTEVTLEPNEVRNYTINVINNFTRSFNFGLLFTQKVTQNIEADTKTNTVARILIPVLISGRGRVLGLSTDQNLFELNTQSIYTDNNINFDMNVENPSSENITPVGVITIQKKFGWVNESTSNFNSDNRVVLSDTDRNIGDSIVLSGFNFGVANLKVDLVYGSDNSVISLQKDIIILPIYIIVIAFIIVFVIILTFKYTRRLNANKN